MHSAMLGSVRKRKANLLSQVGRHLREQEKEKQAGEKGARLFNYARDSLMAIALMTRALFCTLKEPRRKNSNELLP